MYNWQLYQIGNLFGTHYFFPKKGDGLPMHDHIEETKHNVMVLNGSCEVHGLERKWAFVLKQGAVFHFADEHYPHEIVALEDKTTIINLCIYGDRYKHLVTGYNTAGGQGEDLTPVTIPLIDPIKKKGKKKL